MTADKIDEIGIDANGSIYVQPRKAAFPYIYREAMDVSWDAAAGRLFSPPPREWSYAKWFSQLVAAAKEQGVALSVTPETRWVNVEPQVRVGIEGLN